MPCRDLDEMKAAGERLVARHGCAFLLKGGHLREKTATDILATRDGFEAFVAPFRQKIDAHGTGCTFSAAIATFLSAGLSLSESVGHAKKYITRAIEEHLRWKQTTALEHRTQRVHLPGMD
jgi:hydroxymethylpyrimidine/phosphomethylpyrimidine kinase